MLKDILVNLRSDKCFSVLLWFGFNIQAKFRRNYNKLIIQRLNAMIRNSGGIPQNEFKIGIIFRFFFWGLRAMLYNM